MNIYVFYFRLRVLFYNTNKMDTKSKFGKNEKKKYSIEVVYYILSLSCGYHWNLRTMLNTACSPIYFIIYIASLCNSSTKILIL